MTVRIATSDESRRVFAFFEEFSEGSSQDLFADQDVWIHETDGDWGVCIASMDLADLPEDVVATADHVGLRIGTLEGEDFHLDLQGALMLGSVSRDISVRVNEKASRMFLYGKDVLGESVVSWPRGVGTGDACIVVNPRWEAIGIGVVAARGAKGMHPAINPVHDLGTYLRDQGAE